MPGFFIDCIVLAATYFPPHLFSDNFTNKPKGLLREKVRGIISAEGLNC